MIYIAGKISGDENYRQHFEKVTAIVKNISKENVFNPASVDLGQNATWADYIRFDLKILLECNQIVMLDDWEQSRGALLEWNVARAMGIEIIYEHELNYDK